MGKTGSSSLTFAVVDTVESFSGGKYSSEQGTCHVMDGIKCSISIKLLGNSAGIHIMQNAVVGGGRLDDQEGNRGKGKNQ